MLLNGIPPAGKLFLPFVSMWGIPYWQSCYTDSGRECHLVHPRWITGVVPVKLYNLANGQPQLVLQRLQQQGGIYEKYCEGYCAAVLTIYLSSRCVIMLPRCSLYPHVEDDWVTEVITVRACFLWLNWLIHGDKRHHESRNVKCLEDSPCSFRKVQASKREREQWNQEYFQ